MNESTLVILKPDALRRGLVGEIIRRIEQKGLRISTMKMDVIDRDLLELHYEHMRDYPNFRDVLHFMTSGNSITMIVTGDKAVRNMRGLRGSTYDSSPGTIRGDFVCHSHNGENLIHCSENPTLAELEIRRFFFRC